MSEIVFFLEEPSAKAMLEGLLPRLLPENIVCRCIAFEGKKDLERKIVRRLRGYQVPDARFVVLRDQDASDCKKIKEALVAQCAEAGKKNVLVRIACHELESWYLADLSAVEKGLGITGLARLQNKNPYRSPDSRPSPSRVLADIAPSYQKIGGSRAIGPYLDLENTRSKSFHNFIRGLRQLAENAGSR